MFQPQLDRCPVNGCNQTDFRVVRTIYSAHKTSKDARILNQMIYNKRTSYVPLFKLNYTTVKEGNKCIYETNFGHSLDKV